MAKITKVVARQVFDSRGFPTIETEVFCRNISSKAICPSGAPDGHIALEEIFLQKTSVSIVGNPRLSKTCLATTFVILAIIFFNFLLVYLFELTYLIKYPILLRESYLDHLMERYLDLRVFL